MTLDNMTGITKGSYTGGDLFCKSQLITCNRVKECNGVCPFEDALKQADKEMDEQTVIDHDRDWIIGCIKHDGYIKTDRFDKANNIIVDALESCDRPSGEWQQVEVIDDDEPSGVNTDASQCSVCGAIQQSHYWATHYYNYCPSCGARMTPYKGGDDE